MSHPSSEKRGLLPASLPLLSFQVLNIKKTLKATASSSSSNQEMDQQLVERECPHPEQRQPTKKISKVKGLVSSRH